MADKTWWCCGVERSIEDRCSCGDKYEELTHMDNLQAGIGNWRFQELKEYIKVLETDYAEFLKQHNFKESIEGDPPIWFASFIYTITHLQMLYKQAVKSNNIVMIGLTEEAAKMLRQIIKVTEEPQGKKGG